MPQRSLWMLLLVILARSAGAQRVQLELRPKAGDTLRMRLDQTTEMSGARKGAPAAQVTTTLRMFSRAIVESAQSLSTMILAITDSVRLSSNDQHAAALADQTRRLLEGRHMRLRLAPDGGVAVASEGADVPKEVSQIVAVMPASFPGVPVSVGDTWVREMPIPPSAQFGLPVGGAVRATFRFDSTSRGGDLAFISMRGVVDQRPAPQPGDLDQPRISGVVNGTMTVNRKRGWLAESRFLVDVRSTVATKPSKADPMYFRMKISQHMHVFDER